MAAFLQLHEDSLTSRDLELVLQVAGLPSESGMGNAENRTIAGADPSTNTN